MINIIRPDRIALTPEQYVEERNKALMDWDDFVRFAYKYIPPDRKPSSKHVLEITFHQLRTAVPGLSMEERKKSYNWLINRGYHSWDDGDIPR